MENIKQECDHNWKWRYDLSEDTVMKEFDTIGIPVRCKKCAKSGIMWFAYSSVRDENGKIID